jgi:hypothetical protein
MVAEAQPSHRNAWLRIDAGTQHAVLLLRNDT